MFLSSVSRYFGVVGEFTIDLGYFSLRSFVGCIGTFMLSVVSARTRLPSSVVRLLGAASVGRGRGVATLLSVVRSWGQPWVTTAQGHSNHEAQRWF